MDGMIPIGKAPAHWGFTAERFTGDSYLWRDGDRIVISFIHATNEGKGHFSSLVKAIQADGLKVEVPTPLGKMEAILTKWGWHPFYHEHPEMGMVEVWKP